VWPRTTQTHDAFPTPSALSVLESAVFVVRPESVLDSSALRRRANDAVDF
jgi:hypothetical protein